MDKRKPFCKMFGCVHCTKQDPVKLYGQYYKRCELPIYEDLKLLATGCPYYKQEKIWGHDTALCSHLSCVYINSEATSEEYLGIEYKPCRRKTSTVPTFQQGCSEYYIWPGNRPEAEEGSKG